MSDKEKESTVSARYVINLARLVQYERVSWRHMTIAEVIDKALYLYGGTKAEALIDALINK